MQKHTLYKIASFLFLPVAALLGFFTVIFLFAALANPPMLLGVFVVACVVIYIITSFIFLNKAIMYQRMCRGSLRDWIKVNAIVAIVFCVFTIFQSGGIITKPDEMERLIRTAIDTQQPSYPNVSKEMVANTFKGMVYFFFAFAIILLIHIVATFRLLKVYRYFFDDVPNDTTNDSSNDPQQ